MNDFAELSKKLGLLEIATLKAFPESRCPRNSKIREVHYKSAYASKLQEWYPFSEIIWDEEPFSKFSIFKKDPPVCLIETAAGSIEFDRNPIDVSDWKAFIDSFRQLRNNLVHGAKFLHSMDLKDRDNELISAGLAFIDFLEGRGHNKGYLIQLQ